MRNQQNLTRHERRQYADALRKFDLLQDCSTDAVRALADAAHAFTLPADWPMVAEGTPADRTFLVLEGSASVLRGGAVIDTVGPGDIVGEAALLTGATRNATVTTTSRVSGLAIDNHALRALLGRHAALLDSVARQHERRRAATGWPAAVYPLPIT